MDCEVSYPSYVMDFDHVRGIKFKEISQMCRAAFRIEKIPEEIEKCDLVCSNCHRVRTFACQTMPSRRRRVQCTPGYTDSVGSTTTGAT